MNKFGEIFEKVQDEVSYPFGIFVKKLGSSDEVVESCYCIKKNEAIEKARKLASDLDDTLYVEVRESKGGFFNHREPAIWSCTADLIELKEEKGGRTKDRETGKRKER